MGSHYGHLKSHPPYVGGDDDIEIDSFQATCMCGWEGAQRRQPVGAQMDLIAHFNEVFSEEDKVIPEVSRYRKWGRGR